MSEDHGTYADRMMAQAMRNVLSGGLDEGVGEDTILALQQALQAQAKGMAEAAKDPVVCDECGRGRPPQARDLAHVTKALDECTRLLAFAKGGADHRTSVAGEDASILRKLSAERLAILAEWLAEAE